MFKASNTNYFKPPVGAELKRDHPLARGLMGCWLMNEGGGLTLYDLTNNNYNATPIATTWTAGKFGSALNFNASSSYVDGQTRPSWKFGNNDFSITMWIYPTSFSGEKGLYDALVLNGTGSRLNAFIMVQNVTTGALRLFSGGGYSSSTTQTVTLNEWNFVALVRDKKVTKFYINSVLDPLSNTLTTNITSGGAIVGRYADTAGGFFAGNMDSINIYNNRALTASEVNWLYREPYSFIRPKTL